MTVTQSLKAEFLANQLSLRPVFSGSVRKTQSPSKLADSVGRTAADFRDARASADAPAKPVAKVAVLIRNLRREVKGLYLVRLRNRGAVYEILHELFKPNPFQGCED